MTLRLHFQDKSSNPRNLGCGFGGFPRPICHVVSCPFIRAPSRGRDWPERCAPLGKPPRTAREQARCPMVRPTLFSPTRNRNLILAMERCVLTVLFIQRMACLIRLLRCADPLDGPADCRHAERAPGRLWLALRGCRGVCLGCGWWRRAAPMGLDGLGNGLEWAWPGWDAGAGTLGLRMDGGEDWWMGACRLVTPTDSVGV